MFLSLSNSRMWYPKISPFALSLVSGFQDSVRLVADEAAGVMFCGLPSGTEMNLRKIQIINAYILQNISWSSYNFFLLITNILFNLDKV